jgi:RHS repeat-associated protein
MHLFRFLLALALAWLAAPALAQAPDQVLLGPKQYLRTTGAPNQYTDSFRVPSSVGAPFLLRIVNGAANGSNRISAAWIKVNGVQIAGPADFSQKVALVERTINPGPNNTLEVRLASTPGAYVTITVLGTKILPTPTSLAPNPLTVTAGASANLTATLSPAPTSSGSLSISSLNSSVAGVPASVPFAAGQSQVSIPVAGGSAGTTTITASANGGSASATVNVTPAPPTVTSLAPASLTVTQGGSGSLTVTISAAQPADTQVAVSSSNSAAVWVPSSVTVPAGQVSASVPVTALSPGTSQVTASLNGSSASSQVTVTPAPPTVVSLLPAVQTVTLGASTTLTLTISAAQSTDTAVPLAVTPAGIVTAPAQVTVLAGQTTAQVPVGTLAYGQAGITASLNGSSASAAVNVVLPPVAVTNLQPATFTMTVGATSQFTVTINAAQTTNTEVVLSVDQPSILQVPPSVTVPLGATSATFTATGLAVGNAVITASANNTSKSAAVHVAPQPAAIVSLLPNPLPLQQGATGSLTVAINVAQEAATTISLTNTAPAVASLPATVTVPAGAITTAVPVTALEPGSTDVTASVNATSATSTVTVTPPPPVVASLTPATLTLPKGIPGVLRVTVSRAPNVATAVALSSSNPSVASVPPEVNIPAGALFADFPVVANFEGQATIGASLNGGSASSAVTIAAAELVALTLSPQTPTNYVGETVPFTATGTMTDGTTQDFTTRVAWTSSNTAVATIASTGVATPAAAGQTTIGGSFTFTAVQTGQAATISASTVLTVKAPVGLVLSAPTNTLIVGSSTTVTVASSDPAPAGGLIVTLTGGGSGAGTFPPAMTIAANGTQASFTFSATAAGSYTLTASAQNRLPGTIAFTIQPLLAITSFTPAAGPVGSAVTIFGTGFDPVASANQLRFNGEPAVIVNATPTTINAIVPLKATTGLISITNARGTARSATPFTVQERESFQIALAPAAIAVPTGGAGTSRVRLASTGLNPYPYSAALSVAGLPAGVTAAFDRPTVALNQDAILTLSAQGTAASGTYPVTVSATGISGLVTVARQQTLTVTVLAAGSTTVTGRVLHADDDAPFVGARVRLGGIAVFTDESGTYRFVNPPVAGDQVLLIDGNPANTAQFEYPSGIPNPVMILAGQDNRALTTFIGRVEATRFTAITPGQAAAVTDPDLPNFSLNIPAGATILGWDGQPVTRINVRKVPVDRLPIRPIPAGQTSASVYLFYFFREGGGTPSTPIPVAVDNDSGALPGEQVELWYYDEEPLPNPNSHQWRLMGLGTVSADGTKIVSNAGVGIPKFCCGAMNWQRPGAGTNTGASAGNGNCPVVPGAPPPPQTANPVDLGSGNARVFRPRPFGMSVLLPVDLNCKYRSTDARIGLMGRGMSFSYDWFAEAFGHMVRVTTPEGVQHNLAREADGKYRARSGRSGAIGMVVENIAGGRRLTMPDGTQYDFSTAGRLTAMRDLNGNTTTLTLNANGFPSAITDAAGKLYTIALQGSAPNLVISRITDPIGRAVAFEYDASLRLTRYTDQGGGLTQLAYDAQHRISQITDPRGAVKTIEYDAAGRAVREGLPEGAEERYAYTTTGATVSETRHTDANGHVTTYRFNGLGFETSRTDALGRVTRTELDPVTNQVRRRIDPAGRVTQFTYNQRGDLIRTIDPEGNQTLIDYDLRFRKPTRIENALGHVTELVYDAKGNLTSLKNAEHETTTFTYTAKGQLATLTDPLNRVTSFTYDAEGNLLASTNPANETLTRQYDGANRLQFVTDPLGRVTQYDYDALDRLREVRDAIGGFTRYAFDANDNLVSATDPNGNPVERNLYDLRNRLKQRTDAKNLSASYDYDGVGNLVRMTDRKGQVTTYTYDALNRIAQVQDQDGRLTSYTYDLAGNLARITDSVSGDLLMSYDRLNRLTEVVSQQGTVQYAYDAIGRRTSRTLSGGDVTTYTYDKANRLKTVTLRGRTASYGYDAAGRLIEKVLPNGIRAAYQYDTADRVTSIAYAKTDATPVETVSYAYDSGGQRIQKTLGGSGLAETPFTATYDAANRLATLTLGGEVFTLTYDANGNLTSKSGPVSGTTTYAWNARNQLVTIAGPSGAAAFRYDALGRRIEKTVNGITTGYVYDGLQAIAEIKGGAVDTVLHTGLQLDEVLARYGGSGNKTLLQDALMSVIAITNEAQNAESFYAYSGFGESVTLGPDGGNDLQFAGLRNDGTGLYHATYRYYDPVLKQWAAEDPIGLRGGLNLYAYVGGNPILFNDPRGLDYPIMYPMMDAMMKNPPHPGYCTLSPELFPESCKKHDECYRCAQKSRWQCDKEFWQDMQRERPWMPEIVPAVYWGSVFLFGWPFYATP